MAFWNCFEVRVTYSEFVILGVMLAAIGQVDSWIAVEDRISMDVGGRKMESAILFVIDCILLKVCLYGR